MSFRDQMDQFVQEARESVQKDIDRFRVLAEKQQAVYDNVLRDGKGQSVAQVRDLLSHEWREAFGEEMREPELSRNAEGLARGERHTVDFEANVKS